MSWKETNSATVVVGLVSSFWRRQHQSLAIETAGSLCVPPNFLGDSYRESICQSLWLQSRSAECKHCQTADNLTFLRPLFSATALPLERLQTLQSCWAGALCGLCSTKRIAVWPLVLKLTQAIENTACVISESWFGPKTISRISVLNEGLESFQNKCGERLLCKSFVLIILTFPMIPLAN